MVEQVCARLLWAMMMTGCNYFLDHIPYSMSEPALTTQGGRMYDLGGIWAGIQFPPPLWLVGCIARLVVFVTQERFEVMLQPQAMSKTGVMTCFEARLCRHQ